MQFQFKIQIGRNEFTFIEDAKSHKDFFEKVSFYSSLPKTGPNGEDDLEVVFRTTSQGHNYYSIVSRKADMEFKLGQSQKRPGELYGKGWEPLYKAEQNEENENGIVNGGIGAPAVNTPTPQVGIGTPAITPASAPVSKTTGINQAPQVTTSAPVQANIQQQANNVLAKFLQG